MKMEYRQHGKVVAVHDSEAGTITLMAPGQDDVLIEEQDLEGVMVGTAEVVQLDEEVGEGEVKPMVMLTMRSGSALCVPLDTMVEADDLARRATGYEGGP